MLLCKMPNNQQHIYKYLWLKVLQIYSFATFATNMLTSYHLYPVFWKAVSILKMTCYLKVITTDADGAPTNPKICRMHKVAFFSKFV